MPSLQTRDELVRIDQQMKENPRYMDPLPNGSASCRD